MDAQGHVSRRKCALALQGDLPRRSGIESAESSPPLSLADDLKPVDEKGRWRPSPLAHSPVCSSVCSDWGLRLLHFRRTAMSPPTTCHVGINRAGGCRRHPRLLRCAVLAFCWYVAVSRLHLRNAQCLEIFMNFAILFFGGGFVIAQLVGGEESGRRTGLTSGLCPGDQGCAIVAMPTRDAATLLGYNVHKEPWLGPTGQDEARRHRRRHRRRQVDIP